MHWICEWVFLGVGRIGRVGDGWRRRGVGEGWGKGGGIK